MPTTTGVSYCRSPTLSTQEQRDPATSASDTDISDKRPSTPYIIIRPCTAVRARDSQLLYSLNEVAVLRAAEIHNPFRIIIGSSVFVTTSRAVSAAGQARRLQESQSSRK